MKNKNGDSHSANATGEDIFQKKPLGEVNAYRLAINVSLAALGFLFGGCHLLFGSYPLGIALVSVLPSGVWWALIGVVLGSLTLGRSGIIYAMISVLAVFLRIVISGRDKGVGDRLFSEGLTLRMSTAVISGFVAALYEVLLSGISLNSVLFGACMVILPAALTFGFFGLFITDIGPRELVFGKKSVFFSSGGESKIRLVFFKASILLLFLFISVSLRKYDIFGIDLSFVFAGLITVVTAKRFGALYAAAVGFFSSVGVSGLYSAAFMLAGAVSGAIFSVGGIYAMISSVAALSVWGAYVGGVSGFLSVFPEYLISVFLSAPIFKYVEREAVSSPTEGIKRRATDMVGTMALAHRGKISPLENIEKPLIEALPAIRDFCGDDGAVEDYTLFLRMVSEAKKRAAAEREMNEDLTDKLEGVMADFGFGEGVIRAFGERRPYIVLAGEDRDGVKITSPALRGKIESLAGVRLSRPEYFRRDDMVLMECLPEKRYRVRCAQAQMESRAGEGSGDTVRFFEDKDGFAYGLISDGMGSGELAGRTSEFTASFLSAMLGVGASDTTVMHALNSIIRRGGEECSATVDLFAFDTVKGKGSFIKSGAAPSYIKKGESLFRIKSETMPIGLIRKVDAEISVTEVGDGDVIVMLSDGLFPSGEDALWLPELLNKPIEGELSVYAKNIIEQALKNGAGGDDMSVLVMKIEQTA